MSRRFHLTAPNRTHRCRLAPWIALIVTAGCAREPEYSVEAMIKSLNDANAEVRYTAVDVLRRYGPQAKPAVPALIVALADSDNHVRMGSAYALAAVGPDAASAVPALQVALDDASKEVRLGAAHALGAMGKEAAPSLPALRTLLEQHDSDIRIEAAKAIRRIELAARFQSAEPLASELTGDESSAPGPSPPPKERP
jgi:HEAT repeat protein